jgi:hypothetical protein
MFSVSGRLSVLILAACVRPSVVRSAAADDSEGEELFEFEMFSKVIQYYNIIEYKFGMNEGNRDNRELAAAAPNCSDEGVSEKKLFISTIMHQTNTDVGF